MVVTNVMDTLTENITLRVMHNELSDKTVVFVTHRLRSVKNVDTIFVRNKGRISESGTWNELLEDNESLFYALCRIQYII